MVALIEIRGLSSFFESENNRLLDPVFFLDQWFGRHVGLAKTFYLDLMYQAST